MRTYTRQSGFSLIEVLIGMTIGLVVILVIMQTMSLFESQRQRSNGAANMQSNGLLALYSLEQETRQAGYGMVVTYQGIGDLPCVKINGHSSVPGVFDAIPIGITTSGVFDSITIARIDSAMGGLMTGGLIAHIFSPLAAQADLTSASGILLDSASGTLKTAGIAQTVAYYPASSTLPDNLAFKTISTVGDTVLISSGPGIVPKVACTLLTVKQFVSAVAYTPEQFNASGVSTQSAVQAWTRLSFSTANNAGLDSTQTPVFPTYAAGGAVMHNLGPNPTLMRTTFAVNSLGQFTKTINGVSSVVADNIVNLQAQYGIAPLGTAAINCWVNPTVANTNPASTNCPAGDAGDWTVAGLQAVPDNIKRIKAIRVAIIARNAMMEKATNGVCTTTTTAPTSWLNGPAVNLTSDPNWQCYRYKVYQTIIPLNNVIMGNL